MKLKIDTYLPLRTETSEIDNRINELVTNLLEVSEKIKLPLDDFGETNLIIKLVPDKNFKKLKASFPNYFTKEILSLLIFNSVIEYEEIYTYNLEQFSDWVTNQKLNESYLSSIYRSRLLNFLIFTQLAIPGSLYTYKGFLNTNDKFYLDIDEFNSILVGLAFDKQNKWPPIQKIKIDEVWNYIISKTELLTSNSKSNIENGLSSFTYLFDNRANSANSLFWAMTGLEALYADSNVGVGYQIDRKSKLFLGSPKENKKVLTRLYDYRSKFLHGKKNIPINHGWLSDESIDKHEDEFSNNALISAKLLTATLQKIIMNKMLDFNFEFKLCE